MVETSRPVPAAMGDLGYLARYVGHPSIHRSASYAPPPPPKFNHTGFRSLVATCLFVVATVSCAETTTGPDEVESNLNQPIAAASVLGSCSKGSFLTYDAHWDCVETVKIFGSTSFIQGRLSGPVSSWNGAIQATGEFTAPSFTTTETLSEASATVTGVSGGTDFCGSWFPAINTLVVENENDGNCGTKPNRGSFHDMLTHEMAHIWGWAGGDNTGHNLGVTGISDHCTLALPAAGLNTDICDHNIEGGLAGYGLRSFPTETFWSTPFVTGHNGTASFPAVTLQAGNTRTVQLGSFVKERGGTVGAGWAIVSSDAGVATMSGSGVISAIGTGTATITVTPTTGSGFFLTSAFAASSRSVQVTVTAQPLAALVVQSITFDYSLPVTTAGSFEWEAEIGSGSAAGMTYRWVFEYSDHTPPDSIFIPARQSGDTVVPWIVPPPYPDTIYVGAAKRQTRQIHPGSYTIWVKVWPIRNGIAGAPDAREYSVCTSADGGGEAFHAEPMSPTKSGKLPPETDAVEGCVP